MIFGQDRDELRRMYSDAWASAKQGGVLSPLAAQIVKVIEEHPEYQSFIEYSSIAVDFSPGQGQSNPYLHMGLHLAIREQLGTDRPAGIREVFARLAKASGDPHAVEHAMLECLAESLWDAQRNQTLPDEALYLERLRQLRGRWSGGR
jgi:DnaJ-domain-containing protein 1